MKKKLFSLMMTLVFAFMGLAQAQEVVQIGSGTYTNQYLPTNVFYKYSISEQIYTAQELGPAGTIESIAFFTTSTTGFTRKFDVYMVLTEKTNFSSTTDWIEVTAADLVYSDTAVVFAPNDWTTLTLDTPFEYDGTQNVAVIVNDKSGAYVSTSYFRSYTGGANQSIYAYRDAEGYTVATPGVTGTRTSSKNQIRLGISGREYALDLPTNSYYKFNVTQQLFTAAEFGDMESVASVKFYNGGEELVRNIDVYMTLTDKTSYADSTDWVAVDSADLVFSNYVIFPARA